MPWCGFWGTAGSAFWWVLPLIGLVFMGVMFFVCFRRFGCGRMDGDHVRRTRGRPARTGELGRGRPQPD